MSCPHSIIEWVEYTKTCDCDLGLTITCDVCPFDPFPQNSLVVYIANGTIGYLAHSGDWITDKLMDYITDDFNDYLLPSLEMDKYADLAIKETRETNNSYEIIILEPEVVYGHDGDIDIGYGKLIINEVLNVFRRHLAS